MDMKNDMQVGDAVDETCHPFSVVETLGGRLAEMRGVVSIKLLIDWMGFTGDHSDRRTTNERISTFVKFC